MYYEMLMSICDTADDLGVAFQGRNTSTPLSMSCTVEVMLAKISEAKSFQIPQRILTPHDVLCLSEVNKVLPASSFEYTI